MFGSIAVLVVVAFVAFLVAIASIRSVLFLCGPNEVLIFSGATRDVDGKKVGFRAIRGGRAFRIPLLETVDRMDLTNMVIEVSVANAYSKGGIPLSVQGVANVKIAGFEPVLQNAIERFLGATREQIMQVAKDTLEGNLRGVLAQLTPEQVNEDKVAFAEKLQEEAEHDLTRLGLVLDNLKIQNVTDEKGYLNSIGRKSSADLVKRSRIAEVQAKSRSMVQDATNRQNARISELNSQMEIAKAEASRRLADTMSRREAMIAEEVGKVRTAIARAEAEMKVQEARVGQQQRKLEADVLEPAKADMEARLSSAKGNAAQIIENGKATVQVLEQMIHTWQQGGDSARDIFLVQKLNVTLSALTSTIQEIKVDRLTVLPPDAEVSARRAVTLVEELKGALGVDLTKLIETKAPPQA